MRREFKFAAACFTLSALAFILWGVARVAPASSPALNAQCPACGTRFHIDGFENWSAQQLLYAERPCPFCGRLSCGAVLKPNTRYVPPHTLP
jgi:hypothetical protein